MTSPRMRFVFVALSTIASVLCAGTAVGQDVLQVGSATADGPSVAGPVYLRDVAGTPLGMDRAPSSRIQAISVTVTYSPASAVSAVSFSRAGVLSGLRPVFETSPGNNG